MIGPFTLLSVVMFCIVAPLAFFGLCVVMLVFVGWMDARRANSRRSR